MYLNEGALRGCQGNFAGLHPDPSLDIRGLLPLKPKHLSETFMVPLHQLCSAEEAFSGKFGGLNLDGPPERWDTNGIVCLSVWIC